MFNEAEVECGLLVNEMPELAMMGNACHVAHVEGVLCVTSRGGHGRSDGFECVAGAKRCAWFMCRAEVRDE